MRIIRIAPRVDVVLQLPRCFRVRVWANKDPFADPGRSTFPSRIPSDKPFHGCDVDDPRPVVVMVGIMVAAAVKFRARGRKGTLRRGDSKKDAFFALFISTVIFAAVDGTLLVKSHIDINDVYWNFPKTTRQRSLACRSAGAAMA